jgi:hypothetical protein
MRYKEFAARKKEQDQQVDEVLPVVAGAAKAVGTVGGLASRGLAGAAKAVGGAVKTVGGAAAKGISNAVGAAKTATGQQATGQTTGADADQQQPIPIKVGTLVPMPNPLGRVKVNKIEPHNVTLDTQQKLGINLKVDPAELGNYMQTIQGKTQK